MRVQISLCISCMGRLWQLQKTLPDNFVALFEEEFELVLVDYNSQDGLEDWVQSSGLLKDPRFVYVRERQAKTFHASKAKNLAHLAATGNVLLNLDADNFISRSMLREMERFFSEDNLGILHFCNENWGNGTFGRIAIGRTLFHQLGGYDESFHPMGHQDMDLIKRARASGARFKLVEGQVGAIPNSKAQSIALTGSNLSYHEMNMANQALMIANIKAGRLMVSRIPSSVSINYGDWVEL